MAGIAKIAVSAATYAIDKPYDYLIPPSLEELSRRLHRRNTDAEDIIQSRLEKARQECRESVHYDYLVVNDTVVEAAGEILSILEAERCRTPKRTHLIQSIIGD